LSFYSTTDAHTPTFFINSSDPSIVCYSRKSRYLSNNNDYANVQIETLCDSGLVQNNTYEFNLYGTVSSGEAIILESSVFTGIETTKFDTSSLTYPKSLDINTDFVNNSISLNTSSLTINYNLTIGQGNLLNLFTCDLLRDNETRIRQTSKVANTSYSFTDTIPANTNTFEYSINCFNSEVDETTGIYIYQFVNDPAGETELDVLKDLRVIFRNIGGGLNVLWIALIIIFLVWLSLKLEMPLISVGAGILTTIIGLTYIFVFEDIEFNNILGLAFVLVGVIVAVLSSGLQLMNAFDGKTDEVDKMYKKY